MDNSDDDMQDDESMSADNYSSDQDNSSEYSHDSQDDIDVIPVKKMRTNSKFSLPTKEEQLHLRETENLMRSNLLKLQVDEMLTEVREDKSWVRNKLSDWLILLIQDLSEGSSSTSKTAAVAGFGQKTTMTDIDESWLRTNKISGITLDNYFDSNVSLNFKPPVSVDVIGSYKTKTITKPFLNVDIAVTMPAECFDARDILNYSYFDKRKLYLGALIFKLLHSTQLTTSRMYITTAKGDYRKPILVLKPGIKTNFVVKIYPVLPKENLPFKLSQLRPTKNNVRPLSWMRQLRENETQRKEYESSTQAKKKKSSLRQDNLDGSKAGSLDVSSLQPTPHYNMLMLEDIVAIQMSQILTSIIDDYSIMRDTILLLKVWISKRGLRSGFDSIDGYEVTMLAVFLVKSKRILPQMSPLMAFTAVLKYLAETKFDTESLSFTSENVESFVSSYSTYSRPAAVLLLQVSDEGTSPDTFYNLFWRWSSSSVASLQAYALQSLSVLQSEAIYTDVVFNDLFIKKSNFFTECDLYFHLPVPNRSSLIALAETLSIENYAENAGADLLSGLCDLTPWQYFAAKTSAILNQALGQRVISIRTLSSPVALSSQIQTNASELNSPMSTYDYLVHCPLWSFDEKIPATEASHIECYLTVGVVLNRDNSYQRVTKGPSAEDAEGCSSFRSFWGSKSQLRRFHDGTIVEACVWGTSAHQAGNQVPRGEAIVTEIVKYVVSRHLPFLDHSNHTNFVSGMRTVCSQLESFLPGSVDPETGALLSTTFDIFHPNADAATLCRRAIEAADVLRGIMTSKLQGMPLAIDSFSLASAELRYSTYFPPVSHPLILSAAGEGKSAVKAHSGQRITRLNNVIPVVLSMMRSGKWPIDLPALRNVKVAMLIRMAEGLKSQFQMKSIVHREFLDVLYRGFVFRMRIYTENEVSLLMPNPVTTKRLLTSAIPMGSTDSNSQLSTIQQTMRASISPEADQLVRNLVIEPLHHSAMHALQSVHPSLGDTIRLLSRWLSGHMLSDHIDHETLELIAASVYLESGKINSGIYPQSATTGFLKCLTRIAEFDWTEKVLIVDFTSEMSTKDAAFVNEQFQSNISSEIQWRKRPMHIVASYDKQRGFAPSFGLERPERVVVRMISAAAKMSAQELMLWMANGNSSLGNDAVSISSIFNHATIQSKFNAVIHFNKAIINKKVTVGQTDGQSSWLSVLNGPHAFHTKLYSNLSTGELAGNELVFRETGYPNSIQAEYLQKIKLKYGSFALFFWDNISGDTVGIVWKPHAFMPKRFSVLESKLKLAVGSPTEATLENKKNVAGAFQTIVVNTVELLTTIISESDGIVQNVEHL